MLGIHRRVRKEGITDETKTEVQAFYNSEENSRLMPGSADKVSISKKVYEQKRLLLHPCSELWTTFCVQNPDNKIGLTRFTQMRPKHCVPPGASGTHKVCVCVHHENAKLLALACKTTYQDLMSLVVCSTEDKMCMIHRCAKCPGRSALTQHLNTIFNLDSESDSEVDDDEVQVSFQKWEATDRAKILTCMLPVSEFIEVVSEKICNFNGALIFVKMSSCSPQADTARFTDRQSSYSA